MITFLHRDSCDVFESTEETDASDTKKCNELHSCAMWIL
jgi:hypothetical protein